MDHGKIRHVVPIAKQKSKKAVATLFIGYDIYFRTLEICRWILCSFDTCFMGYSLRSVSAVGNSHLWFVVSLFYIYVIFYVSGKISHSIPKNHLYWCSLLGLSWFALGLAYFFGGMLGITGALRHLLWFALGFSTFKYWDEREALSAGKQILSWVGFIATVAICVIIPKCIDSFAIKAFLRLPVDTVFALWGCVNMVFLAKSINQCAIIKSTYTYRFMNRYNYELYLYSDPFNYVLIALLVAWFGQNLFTSDVDSLLAYMIRFFGTILGAAFIIGILYMLKTKRKRLFFNKI